MEGREEALRDGEKDVLKASNADGGGGVGESGEKAWPSASVVLMAYRRGHASTFHEARNVLLKVQEIMAFIWDRIETKTMNSLRTSRNRVLESLRQREKNYILAN